MRLEHADLWRRIESFAIGPEPVDLSFCGRLARDNGWSEPFAQRVIAEYKKFVFLAVTAGHPVTPSDAVDQAWHLHLAYTESYWTELCGEVLGRPLHHGPTRGGTAEGRKFRDWYAATLESYERAFATSPPRDIWPAVRARFADVDKFRRVNTARRLVLLKPRMDARAVGALALVAALGCATLASSGSDRSFIWTVLGTLLAAIVIALWVGHEMRKPASRRGSGDSGGGGGGCGGGGCGGCGGAGCGGGGCGG
jgi:hypothetical protein